MSWCFARIKVYKTIRQSRVQSLLDILRFSTGFLSIFWMIKLRVARCILILIRAQYDVVLFQRLLIGMNINPMNLSLHSSLEFILGPVE